MKYQNTDLPLLNSKLELYIFESKNLTLLEPRKPSSLSHQTAEKRTHQFDNSFDLQGTFCDTMVFFISRHVKPGVPSMNDTESLEK